MVRVFRACTVFGAVLPLLHFPPATAQPLTLDDVVSPTRLALSAPSAPRWSSDSQYLAFLWSDSPDKPQAVWYVRSGDQQPQRLVNSDGISEFAWIPGQRAIAALKNDQLWRFDLQTGRASMLASQISASRLTLCGSQAVFLSKGDLWKVPIDGGEAQRLTHLAIGGPSPNAVGIYARRDREVGSATWPSRTPVIACAPDQNTVAIHVVDRRALRKVPFPNYLQPETEPTYLRRPYPGDLNESRTVHLVDIHGGQITPIDLPHAARMLVVHLAWSSQGKLLVDRMSDDNTVRQLHVITPQQPSRIVWQDHRETRIYTEASSTWSTDGTKILMTGDLEDRYRIYEIDLHKLTAPQALTPAESDAHGPAYPLTTGGFLYVAGAPDPAERHVWRGSRDRPSVRLTRRAGTHRAWPSPDGRMLALIYSSDTTPPELWLTSIKSDRRARITHGRTARLESTKIVKPRYVQIPGPRGALRAKVWRPRIEEPAPILFGPVYVNTVRNRWNHRWGLLVQLLVQRGYIVTQVDVRGST
ncbi:MAG: DPP IV N-terminal domain-containing protein, partial [Myxococcota bacterium]